MDQKSHEHDQFCWGSFRMTSYTQNKLAKDIKCTTGAIEKKRSGRSGE